MHQREVALMESFLAKSTSYFEFGMGGSTCLAAQLVRDRVSAIDSSLEWIQKVREAIGENPRKQIDLRHIDVGPLGAWGMPLSRKRQEHLFPAYSLAIEENGHFDLCLVDGRFRVASFMQALLMAEQETVLAIHDYAGRRKYHVVEEFARPIAQCRQLAFFVRRSGMDREKALRCAELYRRDPA
ncbi:hypothetical protein [Mesorhizobium sp. 10J20-29]